MWLIFKVQGKSLERKLRFGILMLSLEVLLLRIALAGLHDVNLDVQISWQAQYFVGLKVQISRRQRFVNLEVQICGRRSKCALICVPRHLSLYL